MWFKASETNAIPKKTAPPTGHYKEIHHVSLFFKRSAKMTCEQLFRLPELFSQVDVKQNNKIMGQEELRNYWV